MKAIGIILAGGNSKRVGKLSDKRAIAALPIAGSYRAIDFALSNMTNSKVNKVAVFPQFNARSLNEHLSSANGGTSEENREDCTFSRRQSPRAIIPGIWVRQMRCIRIWII